MLILGLIIFFWLKKKKPESIPKQLSCVHKKNVNLGFSLEYFKTDANSD